MKGYRTLALLCLLLGAFALSAISACGTLEIGIEIGAATSVVPTEPAPAQPAPRTPTPTPADYVPPTPKPAFTPVPAYDYPAPTGLRVVFIRDSQMWLWTAEGKRAILLTSMDDGNGTIRLSDDGELVAFQRESELWVVHSDGTGERPLLSLEAFEAMEPVDRDVALHRFEWMPGTHLVAFSTRQRTSIGSVPNHDLRQVDADTMEQTLLLPPGEGGEFYYSPDGRQIAIVTPGKISLVDADGGNRRDGILTHTPVATSSGYEYYAQPVWAADGTALRVAIPPADPQARPFQQTTIWHIPADGRPASLVTSVEAAPLLGPDVLTFSHDLDFVAYYQLRGAVGAALESGSLEGIEPWLEVRRLENDDVQAYAEVVGQYGWAPDSWRFAFVSGRQLSHLQIGQWSGGTMPGSINAGTPVHDVRWVDAEGYLFVVRHNGELGAEGDSWDLGLGDIHGSSTILASTGDSPQYDFTLVDPSGQVALPTPASIPTTTPSAAPRVTTPQELRPTPTPVAPLVGMVYRQAGRLWTDIGLERVQLFERADVHLSSDGNLALYLEKDGEDQDLWLADLISGERHNLTDTPDRIEGNPRWWPARPGVVLFSSLPEETLPGPGVTGLLTAVKLDGSDYRVLDDRNHVGGTPAPSPDGQTVAYGSGSTGWLYHWETGTEVFDPADYGLEEAGEIEIGNPAWSPDGTKLAWIVGGNFAEGGWFGWGIAVFDLERRTAQLLFPHSEPAAGGGSPSAPVWSPDSKWLAFEPRGLSPDTSGVWVVRADGRGEGAAHLGGSHPVWSRDGNYLAFSGTAQGKQGHWLSWAGTWNLHALDLPPSAQIVDWIMPRPSPAPSSYCELSPLQVPIVVPGAPTRDMLCLEYRDPETGVVARILDYGADAGSIAPGDEVTFGWRADGGDMVILEIYDTASVGRAKESGATSVPVVELYDNLPLTGNQAVPMPENLVGGARVVFWVANRGPAGSATIVYRRLAYAVLDLPRRDR